MSWLVGWVFLHLEITTEVQGYMEGVKWYRQVELSRCKMCYKSARLSVVHTQKHIIVNFRFFDFS